MDDEAYKRVDDCQSGTVQGTRNRHKKHSSLFPTIGSLQFVVMDILGPSSTTKSGNHQCWVSPEHYFKLNQAIPVDTVYSTN